ncbi:MAG TPA: hypothetical protein VKD90_29050 [Gemmataceae bacterium]|nr:hypothetical protein [Gemmataceae bacterium]
MRPVSPSARSRRPRLSVESLEGRLVPAGTVTASLSALGVLTLTGTDDDNGITLKVTGSNVTLTPDGTTTLVGSVPPTGVVKSINVVMKGGADVVSIDGTSAFQVPGAVTISLGDGDNTLDMTTTGKIQVGALTVKGGDGLDTVTVKGGAMAGSMVTGAASFLYGTGGSSTTWEDVKFNTTAKVVAGEAGGRANEVTANNVTVAGAMTASLSNAAAATVTVTGASSLGALTETGYVVGALLNGTTVKGSVTIKATYQGDLQVDGATVNGSVVLKGALPSVHAINNGTLIKGNLALTGTGWTDTSFATDSLSEVKGAVTVIGGWFNDQFATNDQFKVGKTVSLTLNGGDNSVAIGGGTNAVAIGGGLTVKAGAGIDTVALDHLTVAGATNLSLGAGNDSLQIENGSTFTGAFTANLGTGDDGMSVAQNTALDGSLGATTFTGAAKILAGAGNDTLALGLDAMSGGDGNSMAIFSSLTNMLDGGLGLDTFDQPTGHTSGALTVIGWNP